MHNFIKLCKLYRRKGELSTIFNNFPFDIIIVIFFHCNIKETYLARAKKDFGKTKLVILVVHPESVKQSLQQ